MNEPKKNDELIISTSDLLSICQKAKKKIIIGILCFSAIGLLYSIQRPIKYEAKATFREKINATSGMDSSALTAMIFSGNTPSTNSGSISTMKSRRLLENIIHKAGLQASINSNEWNFPKLRRIKDNIVVEYALFTNALRPAVTDPAPLLQAKNVNYSGEIPHSIKITFISDQIFEVFEESNKIGQGKLDTPFQNKDYTFTLFSEIEQPLDSKSFSIQLNPISPLVKDLIANLKIDTDNEDSTLIKISYCHNDRHLACTVVNDLMFAFQNYLKDEQERISSEQISYLKAREEEMAFQLKNMMEAYGDQVSEDVYHLGFANSQSALDFLSKQLLVFEEKTRGIDLKLKRLEKAKDGTIIYETAFLLEMEQTPVQISLNEIRELKLQSDSIELALRNSPIQNQEELKAAFIKQIFDLEEVRVYRNEAQTLLASLGQGIVPSPSEKLFNNPHYLAKEWYEKLIKSKKTQAFEENKNQYITYLTNLNRYLEVQEKTIEERMAHQQSFQLDFQGINLQTAQELYVQLSTSLSQIESNIAERKFILEQMKEPGFEISSLSIILNDSVSGSMIEKASQIVLQLNDERNRSEMERERLRKDLAIQNKFLTFHYKQNLQLLELTESLLREKIYSIQSATLELIHQKISVLEKQLTDFVYTRINSLEQEHSLLAQQQLIIRGEMAKLPKKWVAENLVQQHLKMNEKMVEEVTKLVESKNIAKNLEIVQSAPLDFAYTPLHPNSPKILFFTVLGALFGAFFTVSGIVARTIFSGIHVSKENLGLAQVHVAGTFGNKDNLAVLRRLGAFFETGGYADRRSVLFIMGKAPNYSSSLANLISKQGSKVLLISLDFNEKTDQADACGLLQYIEGKIAEPKINTMEGNDAIASGGFSPYGYELIKTKAFEELINKLKSKYNWIIATCSINPDTAEAEGLIPLFDCAVINVHDEKLQDLSSIIDIAKEDKSERKISFVVV